MIMSAALKELREWREEEEAKSYFEALDYAFDKSLCTIRGTKAPKAFLMTKPSWLERILRRISLLFRR